MLLSTPHIRGSLDFNGCQELKNPWNDNKPVKISRDGQVMSGTHCMLGMFLPPLLRLVASNFHYFLSLPLYSRVGPLHARNVFTSSIKIS